MLLCRLLAWFTAGLFIGPPLAIIHKHMHDSRQLAGRRSLPQVATLIHEYHARQDAPPTVDITFPSAHLAGENNVARQIGPGGESEQVATHKAREFDNSILATTEINPVHDDIYHQSNGNDNCTELQECASKNHAQFGERETQQMVHDIFPTDDLCSAPNHPQVDRNTFQNDTLTAVLSSTLPVLSVSSEYIKFLLTCSLIFAWQAVHDKPVSQHIYQHFRRILSASYCSLPRRGRVIVDRMMEGLHGWKGGWCNRCPAANPDDASAQSAITPYTARSRLAPSSPLLSILRFTSPWYA